MGVIYTNSGALKLMNTIRTELAVSTVHLIQPPLTFQKNLTLAQLTAQEATYDGYAAIPVTAWNQAYLDPVGGASINAGIVQFNFTFGAGITNQIIGFWLEDAATVVIEVNQFDSPFPMVQNGDSVPITLVLNSFN